MTRPPQCREGSRRVEDLAYRPEQGQPSADKHGDLRSVFPVWEDVLSGSGCSQLAGEHIRPSSVLHNGAEFGHVVRPTRVESMQQKLVRSASSGSAVLITAPLRCAHVLQSGKLTECLWILLLLVCQTAITQFRVIM